MPGIFWRYFLPIILVVGCSQKKLTTNREKALAASRSMKGPGHIFFSCSVAGNLDSCVYHFKSRAKNEYEKNVVANSVFSMDTETSFRLHEEAYRGKPDEVFFIEQYAVELQRKHRYAEAAVLYEKWEEMFPENFRVKVLLSDCYMNLGRTEESLQKWQLADHSKHRAEIEGVIEGVYGNTGQYSLRNYYRTEIQKGNTSLLYDLFYLDLNWEYDWWHKGTIEEEYLNADIHLLNEKAEKKSELYKSIEAYIKIKNPEATQFMVGLTEMTTGSGMTLHGDITTNDYNESLKEVEKEILNIINNSLAPDDSIPASPAKEEKFDKSNYIRNVLLTYSLVLNGNRLPENGKVAADFLDICLANALVTKEGFLREKGQELLKRSSELKDPDFFGMYTHCMAPSDPAVLEMNKKGWQEYKEERFAWTYLVKSLIARKLNESELDQAILEFPNSSRLYLIKTQKAKLENRDMKPYLTELIKKEFRRLDSGIGLGPSYGEGHNSNALKLYFEILQKSLRRTNGLPGIKK